MSAHTVLLTGGCGLIGSNVARQLNAEGITDILIVDRLRDSPHKWKTLSSLRFADYMDADTFAADGFRKGYAALRDVKTVIHCGANSATTETDVAYLMRTNYDFSQWLAIWAKEYNARFVYASSAATYGADAVMDDTSQYIDYLDSLRPLNPYGFSKSLFDRWMAREGRLNGKGAAVGLKYTNVFGHPEHHKGDMRSVVCKAYDSLRAGKPIQLFESANPEVKTSEIRRDFISVEDAAAVTVWAAVGEGKSVAGLFNVGSGVATSFVDLATYTAEAFVTARSIPRDTWTVEGEVHSMAFSGIKTKKVQLSFPYVQYVAMPQHLRSRYQYVTCAPITKLRDAGYTAAFTPLKDAVERYVGELAKEDVT